MGKVLKLFTGLLIHRKWITTPVCFYRATVTPRGDDICKGLARVLMVPTNVLIALLDSTAQ